MGMIFGHGDSDLLDEMSYGTPEEREAALAIRLAHEREDAAFASRDAYVETLEESDIPHVIKWLEAYGYVVNKK
jgi:hypothetical protein